MTNLQEDSRGPLFGDRFAHRVLFWTPVGLGAGLAALVLLAGVVPSLLRSGSTQESLQTTEAVAAQLPAVRLQLEEERRRVERIQQQRATLLSLIGRPGTLATFLAEIDRLAAVEQVQLDLYEPQAAAAPAGATPPGPPATTPPGPAGVRPGAPAHAALQVEGLQRTTLLVSARGAYPALLRFLRSLERLDVLVAQSDLSLALEATLAPAAPQANPAPAQAGPPGAAAAAAPAAQAQAGAAPAPAPAPRVVMKLAISLYEPAPPSRQPGSQLPGRP